MKKSPLSAGRARRAVVTATVSLAAAGALGGLLTGAGVFTAAERPAAPPSGTSAAQSPPSEDAALAETPERAPATPAASATASPSAAPAFAAVEPPATSPAHGSSPNVSVRSFKMETPAPAPWTEERARPAPNAAGDGHTFTQAQGHYTAEITGEGVTLTFGESAPAGAPPFSLRLKSGDTSDGGSADTAVRLSGNTVEIPRGNDITEWYKSTPKGVMQAFTLARPQTGEAGKGVRLELAAPETWTAVTDAGDTSIRFRHAANGAEVGYQNLIVSDATGRRLPSRMEPLAGGSGVALLAADAGAVYPVTVDPLYTLETVIATPPGTVEGGRISGGNPVILGNTLFFGLAGADGKSLGLWKAGLGGPLTPARVGDLNFGLLDSFAARLLGKAGDKVYAMTPQGEAYHWKEDSTSATAAFTLSPPSTRYQPYPFFGARGDFVYLGVEEFTLPGLLLNLNTATDTRTRLEGSFRDLGSVAMAGDTLTYNGFGGLHYRTASGATGLYETGGESVSLYGSLSVNGKLLVLRDGGAISTLAVGAEGLGPAIPGGGDLATGAVMGNTAYFARERYLWKSDGTVAGTSQVSTGAVVEGQIYSVNGVLCFIGPPGSVWRSDGTTAGTTLLKSWARIVAAGEDRLYLLVTTAAEGEELWVTDGTEAGTKIVRDMTPGPDSTAYSDLVSVGNRLVFRALGKLWLTDGTEAGVTPLFPEPPPATALTTISDVAAAGSRVFFTGGTRAEGAELWVADPAAGTARLVKDIIPGAVGSAPYHTTALRDGVALFLISLSDVHKEMWVTDGTEAGTVRLVGGVSGAGSPLFVSGGAGWISLSVQGGPQMLCRTDGTPAGTALLKTDSNWSVQPPRNLTAHGSGIVFTAGGAGLSADYWSVWRSDGTAAGTQPVTGLPADAFYKSAPQVMTSEGKVFVGNYGSAWVGTGEPLSFRKFEDQGGGYFLTAGKGRVYFHDRQKTLDRLASSDGTPGNYTLGRDMPLNFAESGVVAGNVLYTWTMKNTTPNLTSVEVRASNPETLTDYPLLTGTQYSIGSGAVVSGLVPIGDMVLFYYRNNASSPYRLILADGKTGQVTTIPDALVNGAQATFGSLSAEGDHVYYATGSATGHELRRLTLGVSLKVTASPPEGGTVTGGLESILELGPKPISATPAPGYYFQRWDSSDAGIANRLSASTTFDLPAGSAPYEAVALFTTTPQTFAEWAEKSGVTGADAEPGAAPAGDGVANLLKYGFNMSAKNPATTLQFPDPAAGLPIVYRQVTEEGQALVFQYVRRRWDRAVYTAEHSGDGAVWAAVTAAPSAQALDDTWEMVVITHPAPAGTDRLFGRVRVTAE